MLGQMQLEMKPKPTGRTRIRSGALVHRATMLEHGGPLSESLSATFTGKVAPLEMDGSEMAVLGADVTESGGTLLALEGLELLVDGANVETEMAASREGGAAGCASVRPVGGTGSSGSSSTTTTRRVVRLADGWGDGEVDGIV